tara:strand:+ start:744 stop:989 length:246 start_codon:yes stop_codon:yes gene_type:complete
LSEDKLSRSRRDFFTNPYFEVMMGLLRIQAEKEVVGLRSAAREGEGGKIQYHTGITDGIDRAILRMSNEKKDALGENNAQD